MQRNIYGFFDPVNCVIFKEWREFTEAGVARS